MDVAKLLSLGLQASLILIVLGTGMAAQRGEASALLRQPALLLRSVLAMQVLAPLLAVALAHTLPLEPAVKIALVTLAISPVPPVLSRKALAAGGPRSYVVSLLATSALLSVVTIPATLSLLGDAFGLPLGIAPPVLFRQLLVRILLPLVAGLLLARVAPAASAAWAGAIGAAGTLLLVVTVVPQVVAVFPAFRTLIGNGTVVVMASYAVATLLIGHLLGGPERGNRTVLALSTASRHPGIAISIALANFTSERLAIPAVLLMVLVAAVASALYAVMSRRRMPAPVTGVPSDATPILRRS